LKNAQKLAQFKCEIRFLKSLKGKKLERKNHIVKNLTTVARKVQIPK